MRAHTIHIPSSELRPGDLCVYARSYETKDRLVHYVRLVLDVVSEFNLVSVTFWYCGNKHEWWDQFQTFSYHRLVMHEIFTRET